MEHLCTATICTKCVHVQIIKFIHHFKFYYKHTVYPCPFGSSPHGFTVVVGAFHFRGRDCTQSLAV